MVVLEVGLSFVSADSVKWRGGTYIEEKRHSPRSLEGWKDLVMVKHTPVFTVSCLGCG